MKTEAAMLFRITPDVNQVEKNRISVFAYIKQ